MAIQVDKHLLIRYFLGQSPEEEKDVVRQWLESNEANKKEFVRERIRFDASIVADDPKIRTNNRLQIHFIIRKVLQIAATILLLIVSTFLYDTYRTEKLSQTFQSIRVPAGNRTNIILPDGTEVWLNANTSLRYPVVFSNSTREVILDGEAYFDVTKSKKPFVVKTDKYNVEVLGTTFDVEAYSKNPVFKTALFTGKVKLYNKDAVEEAIYLNPGQTAQQVGNTLQVSITTEINTYRWREGLIYIEDKSFGEIMSVLEKYYNVQINIKNNELKTLGYRGKLRIADGVDHALRVLQNDFPFTYKRDEETNVIYIY